MNTLVGNTPLYKVKHLDVGCCKLYLKLENMNCGGSIKDRIAAAMIDAAEKSGKLKPGGTILEATVGNTGLALAQVACQRGYKIIIVAPEKISSEKLSHLRASGAKVLVISGQYPKNHPEHYQNVAHRLAQDHPEYHYIDQFNNIANPYVHENTTAPEIWQQMHENIDAIIMGAGTGGHLTGISRYMKKVAPQVKIILADPVGSVLASKVNGIDIVASSPWQVEGVGHDYVPSTCDLSFVSQAITIADNNAFSHARLLLQREGILAGPSTGVALAAALQYCRAQAQPKRVVSFVYDTGNKYLSKIYNDNWLKSNSKASNPITAEV